MKTIYHERLFSGILGALVFIPGIILLGMFIYQRLYGPLGSDPAPDLFLLGLGLFLLLTALNFAFLDINITLEGITVSFGIFRYRIPWSQVEGYYRDNTSSLNYGGFGIRMGTVNGKSRLIYNTIGAPRIVIQIGRAKFQEFVFSTSKPEEVQNALREGLGQAG